MNPESSARHSLVQNQLRAVVADDMRAERLMMRQILLDRSVTVAVAVDGKDAWDQIREQKPDLLLTDVEMPRWSGVDLLTAIRTASNPRISTMPVIVVTSLAEPEIEDVCSLSPRTYFLPKPIDVDELDEVLQLIANSRQSRSDDSL